MDRLRIEVTLHWHREPVEAALHVLQQAAEHRSRDVGVRVDQTWQHDVPREAHHLVALKLAR